MGDPHVEEIFVWRRLTPELSRTGLRPWASENQWYLHEAAKRARLERIVRPVPAVALTNHLTPPESIADNRSLRTSRTQKRSAGALAGTEFVARLKGLKKGEGQRLRAKPDAC